MATIKVEDTARLLGITKQGVREHMNRGDLPIGHVLQTKGKRKQYLIFEDMLNAYMGKENKFDRD